MTLKMILASVSTAALLATPLAAQNAPDTNPVNDPGASENSATTTPENLGEPNTAHTTYDTEMFKSADSMNQALSGYTMDAASPWIGKPVVLADGERAGTIKEVYTDGAGMAHAKVELNDTLGIEADQFLLSLGAAQVMDGDLELAMTTNQFIRQAAEVVPVEPGSEKQAY